MSQKPGWAASSLSSPARDRLAETSKVLLHVGELCLGVAQACLQVVHGPDDTFGGDTRIRSRPRSLRGTAMPADYAHEYVRTHRNGQQICSRASGTLQSWAPAPDNPGKAVAKKEKPPK